MTTRSARRSAAEIRERMLEVGVEAVLRDGIVLDVASISLEQLIRTSDTPRSTVFRIWPHRGAYVVDLLERLLGLDQDSGAARGFDDDTLATVTRLMGEMAPLMGTVDGRSEVLREVTRQALAQNVAAVARSVPWQLYRSVVAVAQSGAFPDGADALKDGLRRIANRLLDRMAASFTELAAAFGRDFRPGVTARDLAVVTAAIVEGIVEHRSLLDERLGAERTVELAGAPPREWSLAALAVFAQFDLLTVETG